MDSEKTSRRPHFKPGNSLDATQIDLLVTAISRARKAPGFIDCEGSVCICTGDDDCNGMFEKGLCGPNAICFSDSTGKHVVCVCGRS